MKRSVDNKAFGTIEMTVDDKAEKSRFDVIACAPELSGFCAELPHLLNNSAHPQIQMACDQTITRGEVCVLPREMLNDSIGTATVMLIPIVHDCGDTGRSCCKNLATDLMDACDALKRSVERILIMHFRCPHGRYLPPVEHVFGILDAITKRPTQNLREVCFAVEELNSRQPSRTNEFAEILHQYEP